MDKIIIIGGGGHAKVVISKLIENQNFEIAGYADLIDKGKLLNINYIGKDEDLEKYTKLNISNVAIGIGLIKNFTSRQKIIDKYKSADFIFPEIISKNTIINLNVLIGEGTFINDGAIINTDTKIGKYSIINTKSSVDHDCNIGDNVHIAPGSTICGEVEIGNNVLIGTGSTISNGVKICSKVLIPAGKVIRKDVTKEGLYWG